MGDYGWALDRRVRIPSVVLPTLELSHVVSAIDLSIATPTMAIGASPKEEALSGYTEWEGVWRGAQVSIGWDWGVIRHVVVFLNPAEIRTNIQLINDDGRLESAIGTRLRLFEWIETLPWRTETIPALISEFQARKNNPRSEG